jgi:hypothetical protein
MPEVDTMEAFDQVQVLQLGFRNSIGSSRPSAAAATAGSGR